MVGNPRFCARIDRIEPESAEGKMRIARVDAEVEVRNGLGQTFDGQHLPLLQIITAQGADRQRRVL